MLNNRLIYEINEVINNDIFNKIDQSESVKNSENFELEIGKFLTKNGVVFKTQDMLVKEQTKLYGYPICTPDFLIISNLIINNKVIKWIDAKNFYGANTILIKKSIKKQIKKYINNYGYGCIIFSMNYSEKLEFENVILIDYSELL